jgi:hypothetical protein
MKRQRSRGVGAPRVMLLSAGLTLACASTGFAADRRLGAPEPLLHRNQSSPDIRFAEQHLLLPPTTQQRAARLERAIAGSDARSHRTRGEDVDLTSGAAPRVKVRAGIHGGFERVTFEWPQAVEYNVVQHADQVTVAFSRRGAIDVSRITDHLGTWVLSAWAEEGAVTGRVALRVLPGVRIRSFSLEEGRIVTIDVLGGMAPQTAAPSSSPDPEQGSIQELRQALEQREATIQSLLARVEQLERVAGLSGGDLDRVTAGGAMGTAPSSESSSTSRAAPSISAPPEQASATGSQGQNTESSGARARQETAQGEAAAPGQVDIDEEAVERALDFTLVEQGALLLPAGRIEITPSFTYTRRTGDFPVFLGTDPQLLAERDVRRNEFDFFTGLQVGLPFDSQLELSLPYNLVDQSIVDRVLGQEFDESSRTGHDLGDVSVGLAKTVLREGTWWPDVILRATWDTGTGESEDNDVVLDGGFQELTGSISLLKRQDPLVFVGGASYEWAYDEQDDIDPGDSLEFRIGTFLAVTPNTSLSLVLNQSFIDDFEFQGQSINGSDQVQSILSFGAGVILGRNILLSGNVGVGLTDDSPDYSVSISLPIRFSVPGL